MLLLLSVSDRVGMHLGAGGGGGKKVQLQRVQLVKGTVSEQQQHQNR